MSIPRVFAMALAVVLLLSSCAPSASPSAAPITTPSPTVSQPAFLLTAQGEQDKLSGEVADTVDIDPLTTRFQGDWDGRQVYLGLKDSLSVCLITGLADQASSWATGCGAGNEVITDELPDGGTVKYLPMTTSATPAGWTRLSEHVFAM